MGWGKEEKKCLEKTPAHNPLQNILRFKPIKVQLVCYPGNYLKFFEPHSSTFSASYPPSGAAIVSEPRVERLTIHPVFILTFGQNQA